MEERFAIDKTFDRISLSLFNNEDESEIKEVIDLHRQVFLNNVPKGNRFEILLAVETALLLADKEKRIVTDEEMEEVRILGWTVEMMRVEFMMIEDVMNHSINRRGRKCWYKNVNILESNYN